MKIPDYYRQFQTAPKEEENKPAPGTEVKAEFPKQVTAEAAEVKTKEFKAPFVLQQPEDWEDKTIYTLNGPVTDGIQHNIIVTVEKDCPFEEVHEYAAWQIKTLEDDLKGCTLLKKGETKLADGTQAYEAVFSWIPVEDFRIYQHQVYAVIKKTAYKMTASFTKKTWKTIGPSVLRMMLSLTPVKEDKK